MLKSRKRGLAYRGGAARVSIAIIFMLAAVVSAVAHADTRSVEGFEIDTVILRGSDELKISWGDANRLLVKGSSDNLDREPFYVSGRTLYLGYTDGGRRVRNVKYLLEVDSLEQIELQGSGNIWVEPLETDRLKVAVEGSGGIRMHSVTVSDELELSLAGSGDIQLAEGRADRLEVELAGSGDIDLGSINAQRIDVDMSGSGDILAKGDGTAVDIDIGLAGSGDIDLKDIVAQQVDVGIAGSGDVYVHAEEALDASIIGSGDVYYLGDPTIESATMGSGNVSRAD
jgi:hypothetical protein